MSKTEKNTIPHSCPKCGERHNWRKVDDNFTTLGAASIAKLIFKPIAKVMGLSKICYVCENCGNYEEYRL